MKKSTELLRNINTPIWQWILDDFIHIWKGVFSLRDVILQKNAEDITDGAYDE